MNSNVLTLRTVKRGQSGALVIESSNNNSGSTGSTSRFRRTFANKNNNTNASDNNTSNNGKNNISSNNETNKESVQPLSINEPLQLIASFHDPRTDPNLVVVDINQIPGAKEGDLAELKSHDSVKSRKLYFIIKNIKNDELIKRCKLSPIFVQSGQLQSELNISTRTPVTITLKNKNDVNIDLVEINLKDIKLTRGDMWELSSLMKGSCVFKNQKLTFLQSIRCNVNSIYRNGMKVFSGYIDDNTKIVFRSESARLVFIIQITEEMYHFEEDGEVMFHKVLNSLFPKIFKKWRQKGTHHLVTIVFAANVDYEENSSWIDIKDGDRPKNTKNFYRVVVDQVNIVHWSEIMISLRYEFANFRKDIMEHHRFQDYNKAVRFLPTIKSDLLNSIDLSTTLIFDRFRDPDLRHTTTHFIIISAGNGLYDVQYDELIETGKKLIYSEVSVDIICLSQPPLHITPLFRYRDNQDLLHHCVPGWIDVSFWNEKTQNGNQWFPRCKIYEVQMMGFMENEMNDVTINNLKPDPNVESILQYMNEYDQRVFDKNCLPEVDESKINESFKKIVKDKPLSKNHLLWKVPTNISTTAIINSDPQKETTAEPIFTVSKTALNSLKQLGDSILTNDSSASSTIRSKSNGTQAKDYSDSLSIFSSSTSATSTADKKQLIRKLPFSKNFSNTKLKLGSNKENNNNNLGLNNINNHNIISTSPKSSSTYTKSQNHGGFKGKEITVVDMLKSIMWTEIENPSRRITLQEISKMGVGKWQDVFPKNVKRRVIKWKSLSSPSDLPITTPEFPKSQDFENNFTFQTHAIQLSVEHEKFMNIGGLMREMIHLRLMLGFQIVVNNESLKKIDKKLSHDENSTIIKYLSNDYYHGCKIYLSQEEEIHRISCDYDDTINVQIYHRSKNEPISDYFKECFIKTRYQTNYLKFSPDPLIIKPYNYNWNKYDQILAGYNDDPIEGNRTVNRIKFVLLPTEIPKSTFLTTNNQEVLNTEEIRVEGLRKLIATLHKGEFQPDSKKIRKKSKKESEIFPEIKFYTGDLVRFLKDQYINEMNDYKAGAFIEEESLTKDIDLKELSFFLQNDKGIRLIDRKWHWKVHSNCFLGMELVSWLLENFKDIDTREDAVNYGNELMDKGLFVHAENRHKFLDGHYFYQLTPGFIINKEKNEENDETENNSSSRSNSVISKGSKFSMNPLTATTKLNKTTSRRNFILSNSLKFDIDMNNDSYRREFITVHYDMVHNPNHCFHVRLEWLTTTPKLIDDTINSWSMMCERYGLKLVEIPWNELCEIPKLNPFHSFVDIKLAINPWDETSEFYNKKLFDKHKFYYQIYLLEVSGFLLDNRASLFFKKDEQDFDISYSWGKPKFKFAQYIHKTGAYIAEIRDTGDLFLAPNNAHISRVNVNNNNDANNSASNNNSSSSNGNNSGTDGSNKKKKKQTGSFDLLDSQKIMLEFRSTCLNYEELYKIFKEAKESLNKCDLRQTNHLLIEDLYD